MMPFYIWMLFLIPPAFLILGFYGRSLKRKEDQAELVTFQTQHAAEHAYIGTNGVAIGFLPEHKSLALRSAGVDRIVAYGDIVAAEMVDNGSSISKTDRGSQLMGMAVGGAALGGVGAVIGGLSGTRKEVHTVHSVGIKLTIDDPSAPLHFMEFLAWPSAGNAGSLAVMTARGAANDVYARLITAMRQADQARESAAKAVPLPGSSSPSDEIERLWRLREAGALTDEEFQQQKARLLAGGAGGEMQMLPPPGDGADE